MKRPNLSLRQFAFARQDSTDRPVHQAEHTKTRRIDVRTIDRFFEVLSGVFIYKYFSKRKEQRGAQII